MRCKYCDLENLEITENIRCPKCNSLLIFDSIYELFKYVFDKYGVNMINKHKEFIALLKDLAPNLNEEIKYVKIALDLEVYNELLTFVYKQDSEKADCIDKCISRLSNINDFDEERIFSVLDYFTSYFNWNLSIQEYSVPELYASNSEAKTQRVNSDDLKKKILIRRIGVAAIALIIPIVFVSMILFIINNGDSNFENVTTTINNGVEQTYCPYDIPSNIQNAECYDDEEPCVANVNDGDVLPFRSGPGTNYEKIHSVSDNSLIYKIGTNVNDNWVLAVDPNGDMYGWVNGDYIESVVKAEVEEYYSGNYVVIDGETFELTAEENNEDEVNAEEGLILRSAPNSESRRILRMEYGTYVTDICRYKENTEWAYVEYSDNYDTYYGFANAKYLKSGNIILEEFSDFEDSGIYNSRENAKSINVNEAVNGNLIDCSSNWYAISLDTSGYVSLKFEHTQIESEYTYWTIALYREDGSTYYDGGSRYWSIPGDKGITTCDIGLPSGTYYIEISPYSSNRWSEEMYELTVNYSSSNVWENESNNDKYNANNLSLNTEYFGSITNSNDRDWFTFTLPENGCVTIDFQHEQINSTYTYWEMYLYRDDGSTNYDGGSRYWSINGEKGINTCELGLSAGSYYLVIKPYSTNRWASETYNFTINYNSSAVWEKEVNNDKYSANEVSTNTNYFGSITSDNDNDWYLFNITEPSVVSINFEHKQIDSTYTYWEMYVYREDGTTFYDGGSRYWSIIGEKGVNTCELGLSVGSYYLVIRPYSTNRWASETYNFTINTAANDCFEYEINNSKYDANSFAIGTKFSGSITNSTDSDWYTFSLTSPQSINISFEHESINSDYTYWEIYLYNSDGESFATETEYWSVAGDSNRTISNVYLNSGDYYLKVVPYSSNRWSSKTYGINIY